MLAADPDIKVTKLQKPGLKEKPVGQEARKFQPAAERYNLPAEVVSDNITDTNRARATQRAIKKAVKSMLLMG